MVNREVMRAKQAELVKAALAARQNAHAPYSDFRVGAALLFDDGTVYPGCNVENASYGAAICAERTALVNAVADGAFASGGRPLAIAVVGGRGEELDYCPPCGICLQVLTEFVEAREDFVVILAKVSAEQKELGQEQLRTLSLAELLPFGFELSGS